MMQQPCDREKLLPSTATSASCCPVCEKTLQDVTVIPADEETSLLNELAMLTHPSIMKTSVESESIESYVPQVKIDCYYITDEFNHIVPFDTGLIESGHKLYLYGDVYDILSDEGDACETDAKRTPPVKVSAGKLGPITEWWFSGFDGTHNILLGVESEYASYFLMSPHPMYSKFVVKLTEQIFLTKLVIEFLQITCNDTADEDSYANLLESVESRSLGKFDQEFLLSHANFVIRQVMSYDDAGDSDEPKLLETAAMQEFIRLVGLNFASTKPSTQLRITRKDKRRICNSDYETVTTPLIRQFFQPLIVKCRQEAVSASCKEQLKSASLSKGRKRTLSDRILTTHNLSMSPSKVSWTHESTFEESSDKKCFYGLKVDSESYRKGDFIAFTTKDSSSNNDAVKFGQIRWMGEEEIANKANKRVKRKIFHLLELLEASDTILGSNVTLGKLQDKTLYATDNCYEVRFDSIVSLMKITVVTCNFTSNSLVMSRDDLTNNNSGTLSKVYYCNKMFYPKCGWFTDGVDEVFNIKRFRCTGCIKLKSATVTDSAFKHVPEPIEVGSYVLLNPRVIDAPLTDHFNEWLMESYQQSLQDNMKEEYDEQIYTEKYRKSFVDPVKGSLVDLIDTYAVGLVEGKTGSAYAVKVRLLYRPQNIYPDPQHILACDERELFLTDIVITVPISANMGTLVKKKFNKNFKHEFTTDFFIERSYLTKTGTICILSEKVILSLDTDDESASSKLTPLSSLDLFAGCGAFSLGFEQMNVTNTKWAIERDPVAAESFKENFPHAMVTVKDANQVLKEISDEMMLDDACTSSDKCRTKYPVKGDIDVILAGPPCQGFSEMNRFTDGYASTLKNSLIATTLSFVDIYRPKYVYIENVRNFFKFKESHVFRLTLSSLLYMGYQVTFSLLQAGSLGVPQSRCRAIIIATASGLSVPKMPHLTTSFPCKLIPESIVVQDNRYSLNVVPYSLHRPLTIRDAISDLPCETVDDPSTLVPYLHMKACSSYQHKMRSPNSTHVSDQASRSTGLLVSSRIKLIPKSRGADWRDLPNIQVEVNDSFVIHKLRYTHYDSKCDPASSVARAVCSCAQVTPQGANASCNGDKQSNTLIPWCLVHTASKNYHWVGVYGRVGWDEFFSTTVTIPEPSAKQGRVIHPSEDRLLSVREFARSQGIPDWFTISGKLADRHRQIGNAVPPPLASCLARCLLQARIENECCAKKLKAPLTWD